MRLKISIILAMLAVAAAAAASPVSASSQRGHTCKYRMTGASVVIDGYDNNGLYCHAFNSEAKGQRFYGPTHGRLSCQFKMHGGDVRVSIYSSSRIFAKYFCLMLGTVKGFTRTY